MYFYANFNHTKSAKLSPIKWHLWPLTSDFKHEWHDFYKPVAGSSSCFHLDFIALVRSCFMFIKPLIFMWFALFCLFFYHDYTAITKIIFRYIQKMSNEKWLKYLFPIFQFAAFNFFYNITWRRSFIFYYDMYVTNARLWMYVAAVITLFKKRIIHNLNLFLLILYFA